MSKTILQVKLRGEAGLKGVRVIHVQAGIRKNMKMREIHKVDYDAPVNEELAGHFDSLQQNLIDLCSLSADADTQDVKVTEARISPDGAFLQLLGTARTVGERDVKVTSPRINDDGSYAHWGEAMAKIKALFAEAKSYITEKKMMNPAQFVMNFNQHNEKFNKEEFLEKTEEEQIEDARNLLEKHKYILLQQEPDEEEEEIEQEEGAVTPVKETPPQSGKVRKLNNDDEPLPIVNETEPAVEAFGG